VKFQAFPEYNHSFSQGIKKRVLYDFLNLKRSKYLAAGQEKGLLQSIYQEFYYQS
jgi:hypothetical protein